MQMAARCTIHRDCVLVACGRGVCPWQGAHYLIRGLYHP